MNATRQLTASSQATHRSFRFPARKESSSGCPHASLFRNRDERRIESRRPFLGFRFTRDCPGDVGRVYAIVVDTVRHGANQ